jgi:[ribosomal protein S5]-alanine N-acetyltransferase
LAAQWLPSDSDRRKRKNETLMIEMPTLSTNRLIIRPFAMEDLEDIHQLLDVELKEADTGAEKMETLEERTEWLKWCVLNCKQ